MICIPINRRNLSQMKIWRLCIAVIVGLGFVQLMADSPSPRRDINAVLAAHDRQLLDLPAVVGVYVGVLADGKTPCLKVMLARPTPETERKIPREIEGFPVITEINTRIPINRLVVERSLWSRRTLLQWQERDWQCPGQWRRQSASSRICR
jgi:hypothetical protein